MSNGRVQKPEVKEEEDEVPTGPTKKEPLRLFPDVARRVAARDSMLSHGEIDGTHPDRYDPLRG